MAGDEGKTLKVRVDFSDDAGNAESRTSDPTAAVAAASARVVTLVLAPGTISENGGVSTVTATVSPASPAAFTVEVAAAPVAPAVATDFTLSTTPTLSFAAGATASTGTVTITAVNNDLDAADKEVTVSGTVTGGTNVPDPAAATLTITDDDTNSAATGQPEITGTPRVGATLTAGVGTMADPDGLPADSAFTYQWISNDGTTDSDISGATGQTYDPAAADVGNTLKVRVSFTDNKGNDESLVSEPTPVGIALHIDVWASHLNDDGTVRLYDNKFMVQFIFQHPDMLASGINVTGFDETDVTVTPMNASTRFISPASGGGIMRRFHHLEVTPDNPADFDITISVAAGAAQGMGDYTTAGNAAASLRVQSGKEVPLSLGS